MVTPKGLARRMSVKSSARRLMAMPPHGLVRPWHRADRAHRATHALLEQRRGAITRSPALPPSAAEPTAFENSPETLDRTISTSTDVRTGDLESVSHPVIESAPAQTPEVAPQPSPAYAGAARRLRNQKAGEKTPGNAWAALNDRGAGPAFQGTRLLRTLLVVDDDERILAAWKRVVRKHNVLTALDAPTARRLAGTERPDLAIVDLKLGNVLEFDLIRTLKQDLPDLTVVVCSGYLSPEITVAAMRAGAYDAVVKPITPREILQRLEAGAEAPEPGDTPTLADAEAEQIMRVLADCHDNRSQAAIRLGIHRSSLQRALQRLRKPGK